MVMCGSGAGPVSGSGVMDSLVIRRSPASPLTSAVLISDYSTKAPPLPPPLPTFNKSSGQTNRENHSIQQILEEKKIYEEKKVMEERRITQKMIEKNIHRNESIRSKMSGRSLSSQKSNGFRLIENQQDGSNMNHSHGNVSNNDDAGSIYSIYKQKIDSMFESDSSGGGNVDTNNGGIGIDHCSSNHNSVQAKIEKMFSDVAKDSGIPINQIGVHTFSVDYLGSISLQDKVTSLTGLQIPLRDLYFAYKKITKSKQALSGRLEISAQGLRVQYQGPSGDLEQMNSFPSIAVWSAVKFVIQEDSDSPNHGKHFSYAFLPLITDPDNMDKQALFKRLDHNEKKYITENEQHSPIFAVVMRKIGVKKQLECHGFVCQTSEDAIVIAATLYKSLVNHMKNKERKPKNKNGVTTCMSTASSTMIEKNNNYNNLPVRPPRKKRSSAASSIGSDSNSIANISDTQPLLPPMKPPKKSTKTKRAPKVPGFRAASDHEPKQDDLDAILSYEEPMTIPRTTTNGLVNIDEKQNIQRKTFSDKISTYMSKEQKQIAAEIKQVVCGDSNKGLRKVSTNLDGNSKKEFGKDGGNCRIVEGTETAPVRKKDNNCGDIFTKVTIPRSGSFLNTGGLTRYKNKGSRNNESTSGGSPLGFKEIFHELSLQEGLHSMDDILSVIIDPDGMSFNDLKPIYKEFLLKLAVTFTKDELYLKSKSIMRRQKKKIIKRSNTTNIQRNRNIIIASKFKRLKHIFQKNIKSTTPNLSNTRIYDGSKKHPTEISGNGSSGEGTGGAGDSTKNAEIKLIESSISTSSYDTKPFRTKEELIGIKTAIGGPETTRLPNNRKKHYGNFNKSRNRRDRASTSEESDFFSLKRPNKYNNVSRSNTNILMANHNRNSSSGYVSCSECSYDSDTCTCVSADKCYCSLGHKNISNAMCECECAEDLSRTFCGCDTDSCAESNKCYCPGPGRSSPTYGNNKPKIINSNKKSSLNRQYQHKHDDKCHQHRKLCKKSSNTKSTRSLEYMSNPSEGYYEKLRSRQKFGSERAHPTQYSSIREHLHQKQKQIKKRRNSHTGALPADEEVSVVTLHSIATSLAADPDKMIHHLSAMDLELLKLTKKGNDDCPSTQDAMLQGSFCENALEFWNGTRKNKVQKDQAQKVQSITTGASTEALSVKKSAEIAALFADIKLSQTTDITNLVQVEESFDIDTKMYNIEKSLQPKYSKPIKIGSSNRHEHNRYLMASSSGGPGYARPSSLAKQKAKLYSAKNGLYTIQSQSDESRHSGSRRSSLSGAGGANAVDTAQSIDKSYKLASNNHLSCNIENSLGYLP